MKRYFILALLFAGLSIGITAQNVFDEHEKELLRNFLRQPSDTPGKLNLDILTDDADTTQWETDEMWVALLDASAIQWDINMEPRRISLLAFRHPSYAGNLDLSGFERLESLDLSHDEDYPGHITSLNVDGCNLLQTIKCKYNQLTRLHVEDLDNLTLIEADSNPFEEIMSKHCDKLARLYCRDGQLKTLELEDCKEMDYLYCGNNQLSSLNLSGCPRLSYLSAGNNQLTELNMEGCTRLGNIDVSYNQLTALDLKDINIAELDCDYNMLTSLSVWWRKDSYKKVSCTNNQLVSLDVVSDGHVESANIYCGHNQLTSFSPQVTAGILNVQCEHNRLKTLDFSRSVIVQGLSLDCYENELTTLDTKFHYYNMICFNNRLPFSAIPEQSNVESKYIYSPQKPAPATISSNGVIDLSAYQNKEKTSFTWYREEDLNTPLSDIPASADGIFTLPEKYMDGTTLICKMKNNDFPSLREYYPFTWEGITEIIDARLVCEISTDPSVGAAKINRLYHVYTAGRQLYINAEKSAELKIFTLTGVCVLQRHISAGNTAIPLAKGIYIVSINNLSQKVII
jgi:hypothetical protein